MNQARVANLISKLNYKINPRYRKMKNPKGPEGRIEKLQNTLTALLKYERIELNWNRADETRGYIDLLLSTVLRKGLADKDTMELVDFWVLEKQLIHKIHNVYVPRYEKMQIPYTNLIISPREYPGRPYRRAILELKGNPFPNILTDDVPDKQLLLHNVLLNESRKEHDYNKFKHP